MDSSQVTSICNPFDKLQGGIHQSTKIVHLVEGRRKQFMRPFVLRKFAYTQEKLFAYLMQSRFYCGIEKRVYLNVKLLSSGYTCKRLESRRSVLLHPQARKFSAQVRLFKNSSIFQPIFLPECDLLILLPDMSQ